MKGVDYMIENGKQVSMSSFISVHLPVCLPTPFETSRWGNKCNADIERPSSEQRAEIHYLAEMMNWQLTGESKNPVVMAKSKNRLRSMANRSDGHGAWADREELAKKNIIEAGPSTTHEMLYL